MARKYVGKCMCGGNLYEYEKQGFLPMAVKCDRCGSGESFSEKDNEQKIKRIIKDIQKGEY